MKSEKKNASVNVSIGKIIRLLRNKKVTKGSLGSAMEFYDIASK